MSFSQARCREGRISNSKIASQTQASQGLGNNQLEARVRKSFLIEQIANFLVPFLIKALNQSRILKRHPPILINLKERILLKLKAYLLKMSLEK